MEEKNAGAAQPRPSDKRAGSESPAAAAVKNPKPGPPQKAPKGSKAPKKKKKLSGGMILSIFLIVLILGFGAVVYFNVGGMKQTVAGFLKLSAPVNPTAEQIKEADEKLKAVETAQAALDKATAEQKKKDTELNKREKAVTERETASATKEAELDSLKKTLDGELADQQATVAMFERMDAVKAAKAIGSMKNTDDIVRLLSAMASDKAAAILDNMDQKVATKVATAMMQNQ
jgi:flagellar motility protein MotE (MotC chaperone)